MTKTILKKTDIKKAATKKAATKKTVNGVTEQFIADRQDGNTVNITKGVWYSGFEKVKKYALNNKLPFITVWSNGNACSMCKKLEENFMTSTFKDWMSTSNCVFWFGYSGDKAKEDKVTGKAWAKNSNLKTYPFMRFYWTNNVVIVNEAASGNDWNDKKSGDEGASNIIAKLNDLLSKVEIADKASLKIRTNPNWTKEEIAEFRQAIKDNDGYCPCEDEHTPDTKCMCKNFRTQTTEGTCHCGLYDKYL